MKLSSLLSAYNVADAKYDPNHILSALNDFVDEDSPLSSRLASEDYLLRALSYALGVEFRPSLRSRMSVSVVNDCCTELKIVVE